MGDILKKLLTYLTAILLAIALAACLFLFYSTREPDAAASGKKAATADQQPLLDTNLLQTAIRLASFAATTEEQEQAREAWRLADHEVDLAFAAALRAAEADAELPKAGPLKQLADRIAKLKDRLEADKKRVKELGDEESDELELAKAHVDLDEDELEDAQQDLAREAGDKRARLQRLLQEHQASEKVADQALKFGSERSVDTLSEQVGVWFALAEYRNQILSAEHSAAERAKALLAQHDAIERQLPKQPDEDATTKRLRQLSGQHKTLTGLDQRLQDTKQLAGVYQRWGLLVEARRKEVAHLMFRSFALIFTILLAGWLLNRAVRAGISIADRRRLQQVRIIARASLQFVAVLLVLLVIFGPPTQVSTMIGLVTAGLTVVLKDFIVSFFGWFTLMGKNGISVGDWVEIEGVSGEVIEIGIFKTMLLELGNWTETGHPTGRRVSFSNSFAMERHYFNFSTSGQWLWDELHCTLPTSGDPYQTAQQIREIVERETQADADAAAQDWQRVNHQYDTQEFSAGPAVSLRPGPTGLEVVVRYITRAPQRNAVKSRLFQGIVDLLRQHA